MLWDKVSVQDIVQGKHWKALVERNTHILPASLDDDIETSHISMFSQQRQSHASLGLPLHPFSNMVTVMYHGASIEQRDRVPPLGAARISAPVRTPSVQAHRAHLHETVSPNCAAVKHRRKFGSSRGEKGLL